MGGDFLGCIFSFVIAPRLEPGYYNTLHFSLLLTWPSEDTFSRDIVKFNYLRMERSLDEKH
jgi:hypothetical protein